MAKAYVTGYAATAADRNNLQMAVPLHPPIFEDVLDGTSEDHTAALPDAVTLVRVHVDGIMNVSIKPGAVATTVAGAQGSHRMAAGQTEYMGVQPGKSYVVSAINHT